jgi:hypothetical protein
MNAILRISVIEQKIQYIFALPDDTPMSPQWEAHFARVVRETERVIREKDRDKNVQVGSCQSARGEGRTSPKSYKRAA